MKGQPPSAVQSSTARRQTQINSNSVILSEVFVREQRTKTQSKDPLQVMTRNGASGSFHRRPAAGRDGGPLKPGFGLSGPE